MIWLNSGPRRRYPQCGSIMKKKWRRKQLAIVVVRKERIARKWYKMERNRNIQWTRIFFPIFECYNFLFTVKRLCNFCTKIKPCWLQLRQFNYQGTTYLYNTICSKELCDQSTVWYPISHLWVVLYSSL